MEPTLMKLPTDFTQVVLLPVGFKNPSIAILEENHPAIRFETNGTDEGVEEYKVVPYFFHNKEALPITADVIKDYPYNDADCIHRASFAEFHLVGVPFKDKQEMKKAAESIEDSSTVNPPDLVEKFMISQQVICQFCFQIMRGDRPEGFEDEDSCKFKEIMIEYHLIKMV